MLDEYAADLPIFQMHADDPMMQVHFAAALLDLATDRLPHLTGAILRVVEPGNQTRLAFRLRLLEIAAKEVLDRVNHGAL